MKRLIPILALGLLIASAARSQGPAAPEAPASGSKGVGDLMITPKRIVLEGRTRAGEVMLKNAGMAPATYRIYLQEMEMTPAGELKAHPKAEGQVTASDLIRFSPRQVDLAPGESQIVRIQTRKPEGLAEGEYRSHLVFQGIPPAEAPSTLGPVKDEKGMAITIKPIYGISIPIIVRHGETSASIRMSDLVYHPAPTPQNLQALTLNLHRQGNRSVMGDIEVKMESGEGYAKGAVLGTSKGVAIYHTVSTRTVLVPLFPEKGANLKSCRLQVTFTPRDMKGDTVSSLLVVP